MTVSRCYYYVPNTNTLLIALLALSSLAASAASFVFTTPSHVFITGRKNTVQETTVHRTGRRTANPCFVDSRDLRPLFASEEDGDNTAAAMKVAAKDEGSTYPIDLPSPLLLGTSMILGIASTGTCSHSTLVDIFCL